MPLPSWQRTVASSLRKFLFGGIVVWYWTCVNSISRNDESGGGEDYLVGMARYDITPISTDLSMLGYASYRQTVRGLHQRLYARAFLMGQAIPENVGTTIATERELGTTEVGSLAENDSIPRLDPNATICFVSVDLAMASDLLNLRVLQRLEELWQATSNNNASSASFPCHIENLSISATHTHSAPGGYLQYALYQAGGGGFHPSVVATAVEGIAQALWQAYGNVTAVTQLRTAHAWLRGMQRNRSPTSYLRNPEAERADYAAEGDTDPTMLQLSFHAASSHEREDEDEIRGFINWFALHGTSLNASNRLISGDHKGYASYLAERYGNGNATTGGAFVAAFAASDLGDVSPNTAGPHCRETGVPCDDGGNRSSPCDCRATGPGRTMWESTEMIGRRQYEHSLQLLRHPENTQRIQGPVAYRHSFVDLAHMNVTLPNGERVQTCAAALGYSFAAGTTDGPGLYPFVQGTNTSSAFWNMLGGFVSVPTPEQIRCQAPKPILLNIGPASVPYHWIPSVVPISIFRVGQLFILNVPAEFTTMAGRRLRTAVYRTLVDGGLDANIMVTIAGLANSYVGYVTTLEEYGGQRYEAASTFYGPHTLSAFIQEFQRLAVDLVSGKASATLDGPRDQSGRQMAFPAPLSLSSVDMIALGQSFGSVVVDADDAYRLGETVLVSFRSARPNNNFRIGGTFLTIDQLDEEEGTWRTQFVDADWCTQYRWSGGWTSEQFYWGTSFAEIAWDIPDDTPRGMYRVCHYGTRQTLLGALESTLFHDLLVRFPMTVLGSHLLHLAWHILDFAYHISGPVRKYLQSIQVTQKRDFSGCSRTFLVH